MTAERKSRAAVAPLVTLSPMHRDRVLAAIRTRTVEEGDCLLWEGAVTRGTKSRRPLPALWVDGRAQSLRRLAYVAYGKELFAHWRVSPECGNDLCLCEEHLKRKTHAESLMGHSKSPIARERITLARRARALLDWNKVREIRGSDLPVSELAEQMGVHPDTISCVRTYATWRESGVFSGLVARA